MEKNVQVNIHSTTVAELEDTMPKKILESAFFGHTQRFISAVYFGAVKSIDSA
jgi:hypothetical protein